MTMTPDEATLVRQTALVDYYNSVLLFVTGVFYGLYLLVFFTATNIMLRRGLKSLPSKSLFCINIFSFLSTTLFCFGSLGINVTRIKSGLMNFAGDSLEDSIENGARKALPWVAASTWGQLVNFFCADAVVVWRASVLWPHNRFVRLGLGAFLLSTAGIFITSGVLQSQSTEVEGVNFSTSCLIYAIALFLSLTTNVLATVAVAYKAWEHRSTMRLTVNKKSDVEALLIFLFETGCVYCAFQLMYAVLVRVDDLDLAPIDQAERMFQIGAIYFAAMYPSVVFIVIGLRRSLIEKTLVLTSGPETSYTGTGGDGSTEPSSKQISTIKFNSRAFDLVRPSLAVDKQTDRDGEENDAGIRTEVV